VDAEDVTLRIAMANELVVEGTITDEGVECPALRGSDGTLYTLVKLPRKVEVGEQLQIKGRTTMVSTCQQGITIIVDSLTPQDRP
jgi:hypothetical protein